MSGGPLAVIGLAILLSACGGTSRDPDAQASAIAVSEEEPASQLVKTPAIPPTPWSPTAFDTDWEQLPAGYVGSDPQEFFKLFTRSVEATARGKYETSSEQAERIKDIARVLDPIDPAKKYAFRFSTPMGHLVYDADEAAYVSTYTGCSSTYETNNDGKIWYTCRIQGGRISEPTAAYVGSTALGLSSVVRKERGRVLSLAISRKNSGLRKLFSVENHTLMFRQRCHVERDKAQQLDSKTVSLLLIGRVTGAFLVEGNGHFSTAKVTDSVPKDVAVYEDAIPFVLTDTICYVEESGEILAKTKL